ncbi:unnamed protein product, partial [Didymodactylos carnosus]
YSTSGQLAIMGKFGFGSMLDDKNGNNFFIFTGIFTGILTLQFCATLAAFHLYNAVRKQSSILIKKEDI